MTTFGALQPPFELTDPDLLKGASCYVNGQWVQALGEETFRVIDPGSGKAWATCPDCSVEDVGPAVQSSQTAFEVYSKFPPRKRAQLISAWHHLIVAARDDIAKILVHETGKPLAEAYGELDYATTFTWWFIGEAERIHGSTSHLALPGRRSLVIKQPLGVAAALVPWNFPIALVLRKVSAAMAAGCAMVVKTSPETPLSALCLANLATRAGFPPGTLNVLTTSLENTPAVAEALCLNPLVKKVTFTGSTRVGKIIASYCAKTLTKHTLELGGNCPFIIFEDANLDQVIEQLMALKWRHAGQACVTANRVYIHRNIHDTFMKRLVMETKKLSIGHGMQEGVTMGALTTSRSLDKAEALFKDAIDKGATVVMGSGQRENVNGSGYFMAPTILSGMSDDMEMSQEEIFAPILGVYTFETEKDVVRRANDTPLGLASYVFSKNVDRLWRMFENLNAGMIGLNTGNNSAAEAPFGGIKDSGYGKESGKDVAVNEFMITKTGTLTVEEHF
ncbi:succinate semialdehyde dehydrogenase [Calycina marina]|uniref:Succinate semialdehyde dehydrogenase n=1 Tax=Calycina marina TaxID=1763456 RepID=A0A9P7Z150_9HELO|nr:succinate semialdehyde dehydrogenase [Calycina marina]